MAGLGSLKKHGPYSDVPASEMGNPDKAGASGSFPLNTRKRAIAAESYERYLPPAKRPAMNKKIHALYPNLPMSKK